MNILNIVGWILISAVAVTLFAVGVRATVELLSEWNKEKP